VAQGEARGPSIFVRNASGLVREISPWSSFMATFVFITGGIPILWAASLSSYPGANWPLAYLIALLPTLVMGLLFTIIGISMPRSGGDYVFTSRGLHSSVGFIFYWFLSVSFILNLGIFAYYGADYFGYMISGLGAYYHSSSLLSIGSAITAPIPSIGLAALLIGISAAIAILRPRRAWGFILIMGIIIFLTTAIMSFVLATINSGSFAVAYNNFAGSGAYEEIISSGGITPPSNWLVATEAALPFTWFAYVWYNLPTTWGGEVKNVKRSMPISILVAIVVSAAYYILYSVLTYHAFGGDFLQNWAAIVSSGNNSTISAIGGFIPYFALVYAKNVFLYYIMFIALWLPTFLFFSPLIISQTRYVFAWAFDRILPEKMAYVSERTNTPVFATIAVVFGGLLGAALTDLYGSTSYPKDAFAIFTFGFIGAALAAIVFPFRRKELYKNFVLRKKFGLPLISWLGLGSLVYLIYSTYLSYEGGGIPLDKVALTLYGGILGLGIIIYLTSYIINKRRGIPLDLVFKEIPPE
jgi:amino acid transporter